MASGRRAAGDGQAELFGGTVGRRRLQGKGPAEQALDEALEAAQLPDRYRAGIGAARAGARALDEAEHTGQPAITAQLLKAYGDILQRLALLADPETAGDIPLGGGGGGGSDDGGLAGFGTPTLVHPEAS